MHNVTPIKSKNPPIVVRFDILRVVRGHQPRLSGAGVHLDRRLRRQRTRQAQVPRLLDY